MQIANKIQKPKEDSRQDSHKQTAYVEIYDWKTQLANFFVQNRQQNG